MTQNTKGRTMLGTAPSLIKPRQAPTTSPEQVTITPHSAPPASIPRSSAPTIVAQPEPQAPITGAHHDPDLFVGQELCGYTIRRKLAEGGMGVVYEGVNNRIGRIGAIKVLKLELCHSDEVVQRFLNEAQAVNAIRHENIVDIYDFDRDAYGRAFFVMEYLEGEPLSARIRRGPLAWFEAFPVLEQTLRALNAAHDKGYVHRDLKPDNIWLKYVDGKIQVKLLDFGIAKLVGSESPRDKLTKTGSIYGTPHYMSPEQINGSRDIDHRTDIYALGVIVYEMFSGTTPFVGDTLQAIMTGHLFNEPPRLADIPVNLGVPGPIAEIVSRMLVKDAGGRYDSVGDVLTDLYDVNQNLRPTHADTLNRTRPTLPPARLAQPTAAPRKRRTASVVVGLAVAGAVIAGAAIWQSQQGASPATEPKVGSAAVPPATTPPPKPVDIDYPRTAEKMNLSVRATLSEPEPIARIEGADAAVELKHRESVAKLTELAERDQDELVRCGAAKAAGALGAGDAAALFAKLERAVPEPLRVCYAVALARLGDRAAIKRLHRYARGPRLDVMAMAGTALAELAAPGDRKVIGVLATLLDHQVELARAGEDPYVAVKLLARMAALRATGAHAELVKTLDASSLGHQVMAAQELARLGDTAGKQLLERNLDDPTSKVRLEAAIGLIPFGDHRGLDVITKALTDERPETRRLAAQALRDIGVRPSVASLLPLADDKDWTVRIAAATAIVVIIGFDSKVLAQASVDWTKAALDSNDSTVRRSAADVLGDLPEREAVPLLGRAIIDANREVRLSSARSARKLKTREAAAVLEKVVKAEQDPEVKEQQIVALGAIGNAASRDTLAELSEEPGRIGVIAAGSLIAVGDSSGAAKLEAAIVPSQPSDLRLAAVQAATAANHAVVVPTLTKGLGDLTFNIRFIAAEGLATLRAEKDAAEKVLNAGLESKDPGIAGRALAALTRLGAKLSSLAVSPDQLLDSDDPKQRLAAIPIVRALAAADAAPLLRRLIADRDQEVRRGGVDAIEALSDKHEAVKLYKPLVNDSDPFVRAKASGQLARLDSYLNPQPQQPPPPAPAPTQTGSATPAIDPALDGTRLAGAEVERTSDEARRASDAVDRLGKALVTASEARDHDRDAIKRVKDTAKQLDDALAALAPAGAKVTAALTATSAAAGATPAPDVAAELARARARAEAATAAATTARAAATEAAKQAREFLDDAADSVERTLDTAGAAIRTGDFDRAARSVKEADGQLDALGIHNASLEYLRGQIHHQRALGTDDPAAKKKLLDQATRSFERFIKTGSGPDVQAAKRKLAEVADELAELAQP